MLDLLTDAFAWAQQTLFEQVVQPLAFAWGFGDLLELAFDGTGWLVVGLLQIAVMLLVLAPLRWLARALAPAAWPQTGCAASQSQGLQRGRAPLARAYRGHGAPKVRGWLQPQAWRQARGLVPGHQSSRARGWAFS